MQPVSEPASTAEDAFMATLLSLSRQMRQRLPGDELDSTLMPALRILGLCGPVRQTVLAERLQVDASTVSRQVRHLEERELVRSTHDEHDGRARLVEILPAGRDALERMMHRRRNIIGAVLAGWPAEDAEQLRRLLNRFNTDLDAAEAAAQLVSQEHP